MLKKLEQVKLGKKAKLLNFKISREETKIFQSKARKFTGGNLSAWLRYAGTLNPRPQDVTHRKATKVVQTTKVISITGAQKKKKVKSKPVKTKTYKRAA